MGCVQLVGSLPLPRAHALSQVGSRGVVAFGSAWPARRRAATMPTGGDDPESEALLWKLHRELNGLRTEGSGRRAGSRGGAEGGARRVKPKLSSDSASARERARDGSHDDAGHTSKRIKQEARSGGAGAAHGRLPAASSGVGCLQAGVGAGRTRMDLNPPPLGNPTNRRRRRG
jgi:hypothetical protein